MSLLRTFLWRAFQFLNTHIKRALNIPPKVCTFLWRACSNIFPTRGNLHRRKMQVEPTCGLCCQCIEIVEHVLWDCPLARNVWALSIGKIQKCTNVAPDFYSLFKWMNDKLNQQELEQWATVSWAIWNARNKFCFEKTQPALPAFWKLKAKISQNFIFSITTNHNPFNLSSPSPQPALLCLYLSLAHLLFFTKSLSDEERVFFFLTSILQGDKAQSS